MREKNASASLPHSPSQVRTPSFTLDRNKMGKRKSKGSQAIKKRKWQVMGSGIDKAGPKDPWACWYSLRNRGYKAMCGMWTVWGYRFSNPPLLPTHTKESRRSSQTLVGDFKVHPIKMTKLITYDGLCTHYNRNPLKIGIMLSSWQQPQWLTHHRRLEMFVTTLGHSKPSGRH